MTLKKPLHKIGIAGIALTLTGCGGGQDLGGFSRGLGGDLSSGYNSPISSRFDNNQGGKTTNTRGVYAHLEGSFTLKVEGDPFDYETNDVTVTLKNPEGGPVEVPAFYDGDEKTPTWRFRYTPSSTGHYTFVDVKRHREIARADAVTPKEWTVKGDAIPGFIRVDTGDKSRFVFDNGARYYPLGQNQAWKNGESPEISANFEKMKGAGENWSRVWMNHWDGKNLDWSADSKAQTKPGELDLSVARKWDKLVESAEKNGIFFQMVLQHHGQFASKSGARFSSNIDPNWESNPWNTANGGFLKDPADFFTDPQARKLTKKKLYYILARYGYSPNVLAWELFNEVENTDAAKGALLQDVAMWHREMAFFIKQYDGYRHLVTTSSTSANALDSPLLEAMDYAQIHLYPSDIVSALSGFDVTSTTKNFGKPVFVGEFGASGLKDADGKVLHNGVWISLMRFPSGAAQYWDWENVEKQDLYSHLRSASAFVTASGLANQSGLVSTTPEVSTPQKRTLSFGAGGGFGEAKQSDFVVGAGIPSGFSEFPAFLQGENHRKMMPKPLTFAVNYAKPGTFTMAVETVAKAGAKVNLKLDGETKETRTYPVSDKDYTPDKTASVLTLEVPAGAHKIAIESVGADWVKPASYSFSDYAPALAVFARQGKEFAAGWVVGSGAGTAQGNLKLVGLAPGKYRATWWDTQNGKSLSTSDVTVTKSETAVELATPPVSYDIAFYLSKERNETKPPKKKK